MYVYIGLPLGSPILVLYIVSWLHRWLPFAPVCSRVGSARIWEPTSDLGLSVVASGSVSLTGLTLPTGLHVPAVTPVVCAFAYGAVAAGALGGLGVIRQCRHAFRLFIGRGLRVVS
jgi:hypothetical protein